MSSRSARILLIATVLIAACECEDGARPNRSAQPGSSRSGEGTRPALPLPEGTPVAPEALARFAPDAVSGFTASDVAQPRQTELPNGGTLPTLRRVYEREQLTLQLEISDALHAPAVRALVSSQQGQVHESARSVFRGTTVAGGPALVQRHAATHTAIVNVLVADRFLVNVKVSPVESEESALQVVEALPITALAALGDGKDGGSEPVEPGAATPTGATPAQP